MQHIIRMNIGGHGYTLYSGGAEHGYQNYPLDVHSPGIPVDYMATQKRIDRLLEWSPQRPYICISNLQSSAPPIVVYGCYFPARDEYGRSGLTLIHAMHRYSCTFSDIVLNITRFLNPSSMNAISDDLSMVACGLMQPQKFVQRLTANFVNDTQLPIGQRRKKTLSRSA